MTLMVLLAIQWEDDRDLDWEGRALLQLPWQVMMIMSTKAPDTLKVTLVTVCRLGEGFDYIVRTAREDCEDGKKKGKIRRGLRRKLETERGLTGKFGNENLMRRLRRKLEAESIVMRLKER